MFIDQPLVSRSLAACALVLVLLLGCLGPLANASLPVRADEVPTREAAQKLLERERFEQAIEAFQRIAEAEPESALGWFDLASAHHVAGHYEQAVQIGRHAAEFPEHRATSLYNVACASALLGRQDDAEAALNEALEAGFCNYDLIAVDTDLELLRSAGKLRMPADHEYATLRHGGVVVPYVVLLPEGYDEQKTYPAAVAFAPGGMGMKSTDWTLDTIWAQPADRAGWIIVCAAQPSNGWINHPSHHALNALMTDIAKKHNIEEDRFQFIGLGEGGRPAATYASMSRKFVRGLTLVDSSGYGRWHDEDVADVASEERPVTLFVGGASGALREEAQRVETLMRGAGGEVNLVVLDGHEPALLRLDAKRLLATTPAGTPGTEDRGH